MLAERGARSGCRGRLSPLQDHANSLDEPIERLVGVASVDHVGQMLQEVGHVLRGLCQQHARLASRKGDTKLEEHVRVLAGDNGYDEACLIDALMHLVEDSASSRCIVVAPGDQPQLRKRRLDGEAMQLVQGTVEGHDDEGMRADFPGLILV